MEAVPRMVRAPAHPVVVTPLSEHADHQLHLRFGDAFAENQFLLIVNNEFGFLFCDSQISVEAVYGRIHSPVEPKAIAVVQQVVGYDVFY